MRRKGLKKLGGICLSVSLMAATSGCGAMARSSNYPVKLPQVQGVKNVPCKVDDKDAQCVVLLADDLRKIIVEFVRACVALGNKPQDCGVKLSSKPEPSK